MTQRSYSRLSAYNAYKGKRLDTQALAYMQVTYWIELKKGKLEVWKLFRKELQHSE